MPKAKKSLGQNFLIDPAVTNQILQFINPDSKDIFLEIGPGKGAITKQLASRVDTTPVSYTHLTLPTNREV